MFRAAVGHEWWQGLEWWQDHGYNGTPLVTALLGTLANLFPDASGSYLNVARWFDLALFPLVLAVVLLVSGARVAVPLAFFWFINPFNDYNFVGGSYLRYTYVYCLALAFAFLGRGRSIVAGIFLALSTGLRVFPAVFVAAVALNHLVRPSRLAALRERAPFYLSFAASCVLLVAASWGIRTPDGRSAWPAFVENMQLHAGSFGGNQIGLAMPIVFDPENIISDERGSDVWAARQEERARERRGGILGATVRGPAGGRGRGAPVRLPAVGLLRHPAGLRAATGCALLLRDAGLPAPRVPARTLDRGPPRPGLARRRVDLLARGARTDRPCLRVRERGARRAPGGDRRPGREDRSTRERRGLTGKTDGRGPAARRAANLRPWKTPKTCPTPASRPTPPR